jgi:GNAT superfamily N-acetyltransferase
MRSPSLDISIRQLTDQDIPSAVALCAAAGWNHTAADWKFLLRLHAEGCLVLECGGEIVATATLICYGDQLAWLGMVLTHPEYRRRGFARRLVESALEIAEARSIWSVKLDATDLGRPLYESLGFRDEQFIERWSRAGGVSPKLEPGAPLGISSFELDREAFGADRSQALQLLAAGALSFVAQDGFSMLRNGARASFVGPCVARSPEAAKLLVESCIAAGGQRWYWDLLPSNYYAVKIAAELDFKPERRLVRMVKGADVRGRDSMIYAGAGFELG